MVEEEENEPGHTDAAENSEHGRHEAEDECLGNDHSTDLLAGSADGTQQCELAEALTDGDLEDVVDDEGTDEGGDEGEDQQSGAEHADEAIDTALTFLGELFAGDDFGALRKDVFDRGLDSDGVGAVGQPNVDGVDFAV